MSKIPPAPFSKVRFVGCFFNCNNKFSVVNNVLPQPSEPSVTHVATDCCESTSSEVKECEDEAVAVAVDEPVAVVDDEEVEVEEAVEASPSAATDAANSDIEALNVDAATVAIVDESAAPRSNETGLTGVTVTLNDVDL